MARLFYPGLEDSAGALVLVAQRAPNPRTAAPHFLFEAASATGSKAPAESSRPGFERCVSYPNLSTPARKTMSRLVALLLIAAPAFAEPPGSYKALKAKLDAVPAIDTHDHLWPFD